MAPRREVPGRGRCERFSMMTVLSKFGGVVVGMLFAPVVGAHFHAICGEHELVVGLSPLRVIQGDAPTRVRERVLGWAARHHGELLRAWQACGAGCRPQPIAPWA